LLIWLPESPRILLKQNKPAQALVVLRKIYSKASDEEVLRKLAVLESSISQTREILETTTFGQRVGSMFFHGGNRRAVSLSFCFSPTHLASSLRPDHLFPSNLQLIVGCALQAFQQLCGL